MKYVHAAAKMLAAGKPVDVYGRPSPNFADFDGDGDAEIAWASSSQFNMFELDGSIKWTQYVVDASGLASCSGYDINGDGAYEVLFADEHQY